MKKLLLLILALLIIACSSDDDVSNSDSGNNDQENDILLEKYEVSTNTFGSENTTVIEFNYNSNGQLIYSTETFTPENGEIENLTTHYEYESGKISKIDYDSDEYITFTYQENQIVESNSFSNSETRKFLYEYDSSGNMITEELYIDNELIGVVDFEHDDSNNLISSSDGFVYEYDNMNNPFTLIFDQSYLVIQRIQENNRTIIKSTEGEILEEYTYEYNTENYPTTVELNYVGQDRSSVINYYYE